MLRPALALSFTLLLVACASPSAPRGPGAEARAQGPVPPLPAGMAEAVFAGGCFWCMEGPFEALPGVSSVQSGYTGGQVERPTYEQVSRGTTGHVEAVRVVYDPRRVPYARLLEVFLRNVDPTQDDGQFCDRGPQYRSAIFVQDDDQRRLAEDALAAAAARLGTEVVTSVLPSATFYVAEAYHQDYYRTHPQRYASYRRGCGRDARLRALWGDEAGH